MTSGSNSHGISVPQEGGEVSAEMQELLAEEKAAGQRIERAKAKALEIAAAAAGKAQQLQAEAGGLALAEKAAIVKEAEGKMLAAAKQVIADSEKRAVALRATALKKADAAAEKMLKALLQN